VIRKHSDNTCPLLGTDHDMRIYNEIEANTYVSYFYLVVRDSVENLIYFIGMINFNLNRMRGRQSIESHCSLEHCGNKFY
jgi:hypothetical protein